MAKENNLSGKNIARNQRNPRAPSSLCMGKIFWKTILHMLEAHTSLLFGLLYTQVLIRQRQLYQILYLKAVRLEKVYISLFVLGQGYARL
jgi:hypothetical protein